MFVIITLHNANNRNTPMPLAICWTPDTDQNQTVQMRASSDQHRWVAR